MNILVVDDERMVRMALVSMLDELFPGVHEVVQAKNGAELMQIAPSFRPALAFVDIAMPSVNGLQAICACKPDLPDTVWVILTCFADFSYAQEALRLGVSKYLLKPIDIAELKQIVEAVHVDAQAKVLREQGRFSLQVAQAYYALQHTQQVACDIHPFGNREDLFYTVHIVNMDYKLNASRAHTSELFTLLQAKLTKHLADDCTYAIFFTVSGEICVVSLCACLASQAVQAQIAAVCALSSQEQVFTAVVGAPCKRAEQAILSIDALVGLLSVRCLYGFGALHRSDELEQYAALAYAKEFCAELEGCALAYADCREVEFLSHLAALTACNGLGRLFDAGKACICAYTSILLDVNISESCHTPQALLRQIKAQVNKLYQNIPAKKSPDIAQLICQYVDANYRQDIGINTLADNFSLTPNYISKIFKLKTGQRFVDYLTAVRISNAKRILAENPTISIREISEAVGYFSTSHFTKLFFKLVGCTPSIYAKQIREPTEAK